MKNPENSWTLLIGLGLLSVAVVGGGILLSMAMFGNNPFAEKDTTGAVPAATVQSSVPAPATPTAAIQGLDVPEAVAAKKRIAEEFAGSGDPHRDPLAPRKPVPGHAVPGH